MKDLCLPHREGTVYVKHIARRKGPSSESPYASLAPCVWGRWMNVRQGACEAQVSLRTASAFFPILWGKDSYVRVSPLGHGLNLSSPCPRLSLREVHEWVMFAEDQNY